MMTFEAAIAKFKAQEQPEDVLPLVGKDETAARLRRLVLAWGKIGVERTGAPEAPNAGERELWRWLWEQVVWDDDELRQISGVRGATAESMDILIGNRIIYPDGTISVFASKALKQIMKSQLKL